MAEDDREADQSEEIEAKEEIVESDDLKPLEEAHKDDQNGNDLRNISEEDLQQVNSMIDYLQIEGSNSQQNSRSSAASLKQKERQATSNQSNMMSIK